MRVVIKGLTDAIVLVILVSTAFILVVWFYEAILNKNHGLEVYSLITRLGSCAILFSIISWLYRSKEEG